MTQAQAALQMAAAGYLYPATALRQPNASNLPEKVGSKPKLAGVLPRVCAFAGPASGWPPETAAVRPVVYQAHFVR